MTVGRQPAFRRGTVDTVVEVVKGYFSLSEGDRATGHQNRKQDRDNFANDLGPRLHIDSLAESNPQIVGPGPVPACPGLCSRTGEIYPRRGRVGMSKCRLLHTGHSVA